uniref:(northern house mosquito) hypothetical protein n=1 Tax=Culex pipiens TaxID=7175 RepID=A0A8D8F0J3_CULPI
MISSFSRPLPKHFPLLRKLLRPKLFCAGQLQCAFPNGNRRLTLLVPSSSALALRFRPPAPPTFSSSVSSLCRSRLMAYAGLSRADPMNTLFSAVVLMMYFRASATFSAGLASF